ncbi:hypothetical protein, partial [Bartonella sp. M0193]|uniref:hypothetical protein n=1 Tax=Bartonella sp. M0193 TaxID=2750937 RepID=UPI001AED3DBC
MRFKATTPRDDWQPFAFCRDIRLMALVRFCQSICPLALFASKNTSALRASLPSVTASAPVAPLAKSRTMKHNHCRFDNLTSPNCSFSKIFRMKKPLYMAGQFPRAD